MPNFKRTEDLTLQLLKGQQLQIPKTSWYYRRGEIFRSSLSEDPRR